MKPMFCDTPPAEIVIGKSQTSSSSREKPGKLLRQSLDPAVTLNLFFDPSKHLFRRNLCAPGIINICRRGSLRPCGANQPVLEGAPWHRFLTRPPRSASGYVA